MATSVRLRRLTRGEGAAAHFRQDLPPESACRRGDAVSPNCRIWRWWTSRAAGRDESLQRDTEDVAALASDICSAAALNTMMRSSSSMAMTASIAKSMIAMTRPSDSRVTASCAARCRSAACARVRAAA
jgi:hypothetical protein